MSRAVVRAGSDTSVILAYPNAVFGKASRLRLKTSAMRGLVYFAKPNALTRDVTVTSAILRLRNNTSLTGSVTVSAQRIGASWKESRVTWANQPGVTGTAATQAISNPDTDTWWELDVTAHVQAWADGAANYGWRITTNSATEQRIVSLNAATAKPYLIVEYTDNPDTPGMLRPYGGLSVGVAKPIVRFSFSDPGGDDALDAVQVQIDAANNFVSGIDFDSGWVTVDSQQLDLSTTAYAGLADAATTYWRCRVRDDAGGISDWSDVATFRRDNHGALTITSPAATPNNFVDEFTPPIAWTFTGTTQTAYRVRIARAASPQTWIYDSGKVNSTATEHTLPYRWHGHRVLKDDLSYVVSVTVWDNKDRIATPGDMAAVTATRSFTVQYDNTLAAITSFTATQPTEAPWVRLQWDRATTPDQWVIVRDGEVIEKFDTATDLLLSGTTYRYTDYTARPFVAHTYKVRAVDIVTSVRKMAATSPTATLTPTCPGFWLIDPDRPSLEVNIGGVDTSSMAYGEDAATLVALGADSATRIVAGMRGLEGTVAGPIETTAVHTWDVHKANLLALKATPSQTYRLAFGDENIPVVIGGASVVPHSDALPNHFKLAARFDFWQNGDLPFDAEL